MSKEELITLIEKAECKKMVGLPLEAMTKADIVYHLKEACCPVIAHLGDRV